MKIYRPGKTQRDRISGAQDRNRKNKIARAEFQKDGSKHRNMPEKAVWASFPWHACNGKKNRRLKKAMGLN